MIEEAISQGRVEKVPTGQSGEVVSKVYGPGRRRNMARIAKIRRMALACMNDAQIAEAIGVSQKAVSNTRYRYGIESGLAKRRKRMV
ncbi:hypothetical protein [Celeribacter naphthalenivorans]|uniref:hypothetical protein n=1 Tax=Celeribacter naphthalenivorans TaxID=1614694 RepID=UPI001CFAD4AE|nr:hypothetical protein [Celeribacter naphthalenivorans]